MVQVLIFNFVIFASIAVNEVIVGGVAFGINSGAYVAEIVRSGIMSIDKGQMEAGRSLGLSSGQTMKLIIMPQAFKNVLPALINEMIVLLKETSIIGYIGMTDITKAATLGTEPYIRSLCTVDRSCSILLGAGNDSDILYG